MNILALNDEPTEGGAAQLFRRTNDILRRAGHQVVDVTGDTLSPEPPETSVPLGMNGNGSARWRTAWREVRANIRHVYDPKLTGYLGRVLRESAIDVAHVHNLHGRLSTHVLPFLAHHGIPVVYQVNDYFVFCNSYLAYNRRLDQPCKRCIHGNVLWAMRYGCVSNLGPCRWDRAILQGVKRVALQMARPWAAVTLFLVTSDQAGELLEEWGVAPERRFKLFNPMVADECPPPAEVGEEFVFYGTCLSPKGTETFLAALEHVEPPCALGVYLSGMPADYAARVETAARRRGLRVRIDSTLRWDNGLKERVASARAVIVPSQWWVTSENVVHEALWLGKPVIVSRMGGNAELVDHGVTGFLFEPRNARELAQYINRLRADAELARRMGAAAAERIRVRCAEAVFRTQLETAYERAMAMTTVAAS